MFGQSGQCGRGALVRRDGDPFFSLLDEVFRGNLSPLSPAYLPRVDVVETEQELRVTAELPGLDEKDVEVSVSEDVLVLRGEKKSEQEARQQNVYRTERAYGAFERAFQLPAEVDRERISASFKKGVLTVVLPKAEAAKPQIKKIEIKGE